MQAGEALVTKGLGNLDSDVKSFACQLQCVAQLAVLIVDLQLIWGTRFDLGGLHSWELVAKRTATICQNAQAKLPSSLPERSLSWT